MNVQTLSPLWAVAFKCDLNFSDKIQTLTLGQRKGKTGLLLYKDTHSLVEMVTHWIRKSPNGIIEDEEILVLVLSKGKNQSVQDEAQVRNQFCACFLLQGGKGAKTQGRNP